jgi:ATP synthase protein I
MIGENRDARREAQDAIHLRQKRSEAWQKEGERPLWKNLSMVGSLGWLIVVPTLLGILAGRWLDERFDTGVTFSGAMTVLGASAGFYLVWKRMNEK